AAHAASLAAGQSDVVLAVSAESAEALVCAGRLLAARLAAADVDAPVFLRSWPTDDPLISAALPLGSLLADGIGDAIQAATAAAGPTTSTCTSVRPASSAACQLR